MYNNLPAASGLSQGCGFNLFKKGIEPKWEDKHNKNGGKWTILVGKNDDLDKMWLWLVRFIH
jgi:translation initiation factor 4E